MNRAVWASKSAVVWWLRSGWVAISLALLLAAKFVDTQMFPVVTAFTVTKVIPVPSGIELMGELYKPQSREDCDFVEVVANINETDSAAVRFLDRPSGSKQYTRASGWSQFGPWLIEHPSIKTVRLVSRHRCHALWPHTRALAEITVEQPK